MKLNPIGLLLRFLLCIAMAMLSSCVTTGFSYTANDVAGHDITAAIKKPAGQPVEIYGSAVKVRRSGK